MRGLKARWYRLSESFAERELRERAILISCAVALTLFAAYRFGILPAQQRLALAKQATATANANALQLQEIGKQLESQNQVDPDAAAREQLAALQRDIAGRNLKLGQQGTQGAETLVEAMGHALTQASGLTLGRVEALTPEPLGAAPPSGAAPGTAAAVGPVLYRHRLRVSVNGRYQELSRYVAALERAAPGVAWQRLELKVETWPKSTLTLEWAIVSREARWLGA